MKNFSKFLLLPFGLLYGVVTYLRNKFFDFGILNQRRFNVPIINVGNLSVGGTGKTPHVEYLINLMHPQFKIATLSRGYGRKTKGFIEVKENNKAIEVGDEPLQIKKKFNALDVFVGENRVNATKRILELIPELQVLILDDAFQHRYIEPSINIMLTTYDNLFTKDSILPMGKLREWKSGAQRADAIIVTKTPKIFSLLERRIITQEIKPQPHQQVFFSYLSYGDLVPLKQQATKQVFGNEYFFSRNYACILVTGIANPENLKTYLEERLETVKHLNFKDHYQFSKADLKLIKEHFETFNKQNKIIITTEKDAVRLSSPEFEEDLKGMPIFYLPIKVAFHGNDKNLFDEYILNYVGRN